MLAMVVNARKGEKVNHSAPYDSRRVTQELLDVLVQYAPNGPDQKVCREFLHALQDQYAGNKMVHRRLAQAIFEGLVSDTWPWTDRRWDLKLVNEQIARGENCPCCGAHWVVMTDGSGLMQHNPDCAYIKED